MIKKVNLLVCIMLIVGGCSVKTEESVNEVIIDSFENNIVASEETIKEEVKEKEETKAEELKQPVVYENIIDGLLSKNNEYGLDTYYMLLGKGNKKVGSSMTPTYIVIHNTANSAPAINEAKYLNSSENTSSTSFHFAVDDTTIYQTVNLKYNSWHAGNITMNKKSIGIEIAKSTISDAEIKDKAIENGAKLTAMLMKHYNISIDHVITHNDVTGKNCPHDILERYGYDNFL